MGVPAVFTTAPFEEATARAEEDDRLVLIDFSADWCAPCKQMDATTWLDPEIEAWVRANAVAVRVDGLTGPPPSWLEFEDHLREVLIEKQQWALLGTMTREPLEHLRRAEAILLQLRESTEERPDLVEIVEFFAARLRDTAGVLIKALRAGTGRELEVAAVRDEARRIDASPAMHDATV